MLAAIKHSPSAIILPDDGPQQKDTLWLAFFDPYAALEAVQNHIETLPGSRHERHTMRAYMSSLADWCAFLGATVVHSVGEDYSFRFEYMRMPTRDNTADYIAHCKRAGLTSSTITRYMAAVRHFLHALEEQSVMPRSGADYMLIMECQRQFRLAAGVKNPAPDRTSNRPALEQFGTRLTLIQVNTLLQSFEAELDTLRGQRDLALLYLGITSGLRAAEIARLTLNSITQGKDCYEIKVRGKRSNHDPIGIDSAAYQLIINWVNVWNTALELDDTRRITGDVPVFQPLLRGSVLPVIGLHGYSPLRGILPRAILKIVERRTTDVLGITITAHDMRRSCAYLMRAHGFEWDQIRAQLRHRSIGTTEKYVGREQNLSAALLSKRVTFTLPQHNLVEV